MAVSTTALTHTRLYYICKYTMRNYSDYFTVYRVIFNIGRLCVIFSIIVSQICIAMYLLFT